VFIAWFQNYVTEDLTETICLFNIIHCLTPNEQEFYNNAGLILSTF
jgi:hypothetical protein